MAISLAKAIVCLEDEPRIIKKIVVLTVLAILASVIQIVTGVVLSGSFEAYINSPNPSSELLGSLLVFPITIYTLGFVFQSMHKTFNSDKFQMVELS